ncbi:hypothetical protein B5G09_13110 [Alistipes sp. An54]|nr:hypothetical protein B5G09_13110 [Alistipes sp. An54]
MPNGDGVVIGELPSLPLLRANAGPSLLAQLLVGKYQDHLPLHRQIGIFARAGSGRVARAAIRGIEEKSAGLQLHPDRRDDDSRAGQG